MTTVLVAAAHRAPFLPELLHPLRYWGYQFWSGIGSDIGEVTLAGSAIAIVLGAYRHLECHEVGCHRHGKYHLPSGVRCCGEHHPDLDERLEHERGLVHRLHVAHHTRAAEAHAKALGVRSGPAPQVGHGATT